MMKKKVLFICTHNSARSQIAEGLLNYFGSDKYLAFSAGSVATKVNLFSIDVLNEIGIDIKNHHSKNMAEFEGQHFDYIVTVCDNAKETCPFFPGANEYIHKNFMNPSSIEGKYEDKLNAFRKTRDEIKEWVFEFFNL